MYQPRTAATLSAPAQAPVTSAYDDRAIDVGIGVIVTTHAAYSVPWLNDALLSIEHSIATAGHRNWMLFVAVDDALTPNGRALVHAARSHISTARRMVVQGFSKAANVSIAKNRALRLYQPFASESPWWTWVDGDDLCLPAKFSWLFPQLLASGARRAGGDYLLREPNKPDLVIPASTCVDFFQCGIWQSIWHRSLIPTNGRFFDESASNDLFDDAFPLHRLENQNEPWPQFPGNPVALIRVHGANFCATRPGGWQAACHRTVVAASAKFPRRHLYHDSIITAAWGEVHLREAEIAVKSFAAANRRIPPGSITVYAPATETARVLSWNRQLGDAGPPCPILHCPVDPFLAQALGRRELSSIQDPEHRAMATNCYAKWLALRHANATTGPLIYFDADFLWTHRLMDIPWQRFGLTPEATPAAEHADWHKAAYGHLNGGLIKLRTTAEPILNAILDSMLVANPLWSHPMHGSVSDYPFPPWADQGPMSVIPELTNGDLDFFPQAAALNLSALACGFSLDHLARLSGPDFLPTTASAIGLDFASDPNAAWFRAHLLQGLHAHLHAPNYWTAWPRFVSQLVHWKFKRGAWFHLDPLIHLIPLIP